jgi:hypothetical protein
MQYDPVDVRDVLCRMGMYSYDVQDTSDPPCVDDRSLLCDESDMSTTSCSASPHSACVNEKMTTAMYHSNSNTDKMTTAMYHSNSNTDESLCTSEASSVINSKVKLIDSLRHRHSRVKLIDFVATHLPYSVMSVMPILVHVFIFILLCVYIHSKIITTRYSVVDCQHLVDYNITDTSNVMNLQSSQFINQLILNQIESYTFHILIVGGLSYLQTIFIVSVCVFPLYRLIYTLKQDLYSLL